MSLPIAELVPPHIRAFEAYVPSRPDPELCRTYGVQRLHRLNNNENPLGPPPAARRVIEGFPPPGAAVYPSGDCHYLRAALAERFGKDPERFLVGNGSCEVIASVIKAFCDKGDNIVTADKTFAVYEWVAEFSGFHARLIPLKDYAFDAQGMLAAMDARTKILFVCNPNNPTGKWWRRDEMERFLAGVDGRAIVVLDEAYREYVDDEDFPDGMELMERHKNVVVFRTFSKMYALAGLRVGYVCGQKEVVDYIRRTHIVYSVNTLGQPAAAEALTDDAAHIRATREMVARAKALLLPAFDEMGLEHVSGAGNFVMVRTPASDSLMYRHLMRRGIMVRTMTGFRFPNWIRVSLVQEPVMREFLSAFRDVVDLVRGGPA
ncbi:histidinol-phosphate aminotransferase [Humidesulfovibrio mexicanus]|uniref:Histidinol-phosphate aminotransferase n=1 Tax=Humidesulfovibrio mexicanus TaxID=147047 RepID=A0A238YSZ0_9BACT|nr:histidinol-phosphate transaminase [Humidesulfovibrio mexicanus]SNR74245.1 histidinol-phosphate aminotransferase [Humidesulfovibrio mexicanus]